MHNKSPIYYSIFIFCIICLISCSREREEQKKSYSYVKEGRTFDIQLQQHSDSMYTLTLDIDGVSASTWDLNYPIYRFICEDLNGDGIPEIAVGAIKTTRFDKNQAKRLFIFHITEDNYIRPLWLGSKVAKPLEDFTLLAGSPGIIRTIEWEDDGSYLVADYNLKKFGIKFDKYIERNKTLSDTKKTLKQK